MLFIYVFFWFRFYLRYIIIIIISSKYRMYCVYISFYFKLFYFKNNSKFFFGYRNNLNKNINLSKYYYTHVYNFNIYNKNLIMLRFKYKKDINKSYFFSFFHFINNLFYRKMNILFLDDNYKSVIPIYTQVFGFKSIQNNKDFFFIDCKNITLNNWFYFYKNFLINFDIRLIFIVDYQKYLKFFKLFSYYNVPIFSILSYSFSSVYLDNFFYIFKINNFYKLFFYNIVYYLFFKIKNIFIFNGKYSYLLKTNKIISTIF